MACRLPGAKITFIAERPGTVKTETGMLALVAEASFADLPRPEVIDDPSGYGDQELFEKSGLVDWIRSAHETTEWTTSVCAAHCPRGDGVLDGVEATTHWLRRDELRGLGASPLRSRSWSAAR